MNRSATPHIHVEPSPDGRWSVTLDGREALSLHDNASTAEVSARRHARALGAGAIVLRDRYRRVRTLQPTHNGF